jgi:syntaxin 5
LISRIDRVILTLRCQQELTYIIKQDIAALNQQIAQLQVFTQTNLNAGAGGKQVSEHNKNVVTMLQTKLADTTIGFKDVLEIRTQVSRRRRSSFRIQFDRRS